MIWTDKRDRMPTEADCDEQRCVLAWHTFQGTIVIELHNFEKYGGFCTHWMRTPAPPAN